ncbi:phosphoglycerate kinase [Candidatus Woesearchaeota archaeon]|nr:phosphoglycerate kinase [Candidatus Woesearchaeota archaeon]
MQKFFTLKDLDVRGKRVLVRVDFNVPLDKKTNEVADDKRIRESLPTIEYLAERDAKVILCSHLGRPDGKVVDNLRMGMITARLGQLLNKNIKKLDDCIGDSVRDEVARMNKKDIILLENLRFHPEEEANDETFSRKLAELAELYVNDAFGTCHRAHASTYGVTKYLKSAAGFLVEKELRVMGKALEDPDKPFMAILGGAKISDKIQVIENLLKKVDKMLLGGAMIFTFYKAQGKDVGASKMEDEYADLAKKLLQNKKIMLPVDLVVAGKFDADAESKIVDVDGIPGGWMGLDIGPKTIGMYEEILKNAKTVLWSGPMGVFEFDKFANGTKEIARFLSTLKAATIIGGGDSAAAVEKFGFAGKLTHISTGGGASLEFFEGKKLPGMEALEESYRQLR